MLWYVFQVMVCHEACCLGWEGRGGGCMAKQLGKVRPQSQPLPPPHCLPSHHTNLVSLLTVGTGSAPSSTRGGRTELCGICRPHSSMRSSTP